MSTKTIVVTGLVLSDVHETEAIARRAASAVLSNTEFRILTSVKHASPIKGSEVGRREIVLTADVDSSETVAWEYAQRVTDWIQQSIPELMDLQWAVAFTGSS